MATQTSSNYVTPTGFVDQFTGNWINTTGKFIHIMSTDHANGTVEQEISLRSFPQANADWERMIDAGATITDDDNYILIVEPEAYALITGTSTFLSEEDEGVNLERQRR